MAGCLRILQVGTGMPGWAGTEKYIIDLSPLLAGKGHEVVIACQKESEIERRANQAQVPVIHLTMRSTQDWGQLPKLARAMRGFDVVHIHSFRDYIVPATAARIARVPAVIMTRHLPHPFASRITAYACSQLFYDGIIAPSDYVVDVLRRSGVEQSRVFLVKNAIDPEPWAKAAPSNIRAQLGISPRSFLVAAAGRITVEKGFDVLLRAVGRLRREGLDVSCIIAGPGDPVATKVEAARSEESLKGYAWILGFRRDVPELYAAVDAVVVPSESPEVFGYAAIEGLAAGKPVIASNLGGLPEIVTSDCGILVPPGDVQALADAIKGLASDSELRRRLAANARARALQFPVPAWVDGIESVYCEVLSRKA